MQITPQPDSITIDQARSRFFSKGILPVGMVSETIARSWQRSLANGVRADKKQTALPALSRHELNDLTSQNRTLLENSRPVMENLYDQIQSTSSMVILADKTGVILHSLGDIDFINRAGRVSLRSGGIWSEEVHGTNAIGTALVEQMPVRVNGGEHFTAANGFLSCSASPVFDPYGNLMGILDVSGDCLGSQQHTMALVRISTQQIENQMFASGFKTDLVLHFHRRPEFIGSLYEALAVFGMDGKLRAANRSALLHLGLDRYHACQLNFSDLFAMSFDMLLARTNHLLELRTNNGVAIFGRSIIPRSTVQKTGPEQRVISQSHDMPALEALNLGDSSMRLAIDRVRKVLKHDIPVLLEGESGTGKELFAQAMHASGPRSKRPFVALNCAAIPEGLIESELFGYQEGAFTGASRKGSIGKIRQADGGTLFLDEIGDMPLSLQARLLRVLQERAVTPLGGRESFPVDIAIFCATNRKLRDEISTGHFRKDLYYRLNGLLVSLPRLREREDRLSLAYTIVGELADSGRNIRISSEVLELLGNHPWPGNIRQLHNVLRTAIALLDSGDEITIEHLPDDFMDYFNEALAPGRSGSTDGVGMPLSLDKVEIKAIQRALRDCGGNISAAARRLGIARNTLYRKLRADCFS
ncbi:MAG: sigma-54-dependent Fis family transcriptional regulator [Deltaproteobacteria bacterium]|nr:sigma-54-dependent Fis family transcriptional regulator [Deltaproteobacteria bacterium]